MAVTMKSEAIILFLVVIAATSIDGLFETEGGQVSIRFGLTKIITEELPLNTSTAISKSWVSAPPPPDAPFPNLQLWCYPDYIVCAWFSKDNIVGAQIGFIIAKISDPAFFDFAKQGFHKWTVSGTQLWVTSQFFRSPEVLSGAQTLEPSQYADQSVAPNVILKQGFVWVEGFDGQLMAIPTTTSAIKTSTLFTEQGCQIGKGTHFLFNLTKSGPECTADKILHWFPITNDGEVTATGLFLLAKVTSDLGQRDWFERPPSIGLRVLLPRAPSCLYELADTHSVTSTHIYYVTKPNAILCPLIIL